MSFDELFIFSEVMGYHTYPFDPIHGGMLSADGGIGTLDSGRFPSELSNHMRNGGGPLLIDAASDSLEVLLRPTPAMDVARPWDQSPGKSLLYSETEPTEEDHPTIVVTAPDPWVISVDPDDALGGGWNFGHEPGLGDHGDGGGEDADHQCPNEPESATESQHPEGFDSELDRAIDELAAEIAAEIQSMSDDHTQEYSAIIWRDAQGNVHRTSVEPGTASSATGLSENWSQVDFANGGQVVAIFHSHPTLIDSSLYDSASSGWIPNTDGGTLSSIDFDTLLRAGGRIARYDAEAAGYDSANYRSYLLFGGHVNEFYATDQDRSQ